VYSVECHPDAFILGPINWMNKYSGVMHLHYPKESVKWSCKLIGFGSLFLGHVDKDTITFTKTDIPGPTIVGSFLSLLSFAHNATYVPDPTLE
jgi:hypothetical protein